GEHWESCEDSTMAELSLHTHEMQAWIKLWQEGDTWGADQLILAAQRRLERLAHSMLRGFPQVARQFETGDILHTALMRLLNNLREAIPASTREFFGFAAFHIRRSLIDLARSGRGVREAAALVHATGSGRDFFQSLVDPAAAENLELWENFHE